MSLVPEVEPAVCFTIAWEHGKITDITTNSNLVNHFLQLLKVSRSYHTWVNYAHDLKVFFTVVGKPPEAIGRRECVAFLAQQDQAGFANTTINRRLTALSSFFTELNLLDPLTFPLNPIVPAARRSKHARRTSSALYRKQRQFVPDIVPQADLETFYHALPTWRDRTLMLLMYLSCLRVSEVVAIEFTHIECSRRRLIIPQGKGAKPRTVYMSSTTFDVLNHYLDTERGALFPEEDAVFVAFKGKTRGQPLDSNALQKCIKYYGAKCNLPYLHAHLFRHTGITQLLQHGMQEAALRAMVGHENPDSLQPYVHLCDTFVESEFDRAQGAFSLDHWLPISGSGGRACF